MNVPQDLLASLDGLPGFDRETFEAVHREEPAVTSIRLNPGKVGGLEAIAGGAGAVPDPVPWSSYGFYLAERPSFTLDPVFHAGGYYVQEASGMFLEQVLRQAADLSRPLRVLDCCAAPGGKSTLLQSLLPADSLLVSNEVIRNRVHILEENIVKWGAVDMVVTSNDPQDLGRLVDYFDVMVVDAPCSGSGLFRRDPTAAGEWSLDNVRLCHQRQQRILADCWPALRSDGLLVYSTCSYSREENEDIVGWMIGELGATGLRLRVRDEWKIVETVGGGGGYGYRFYPDRLRGEGLYMAAVRKTGDGVFMAHRRNDDTTTHRTKDDMERLARKDISMVSEWARPGLDLAYFYQGDVIHAIPAPLLSELSLLRRRCYLRKAGVAMGRQSVKEFIPEHDLAVSMAAGRFPALALTKEEALRYLRKDDLRSEGLQRGWTVVQYEGLNLGWIKVLPGRINNYYPKEWRILRRET